MTATLIAILIADGTLPRLADGWDSTLATLLPSTAPGTAYELVTLRQLVSNQASINPTTNCSLSSYSCILEGLKCASVLVSRAEYARCLLLQTPESPPGSVYKYSNAGFIMAGHIVEELLGISWFESGVEPLILCE